MNELPAEQSLHAMQGYFKAGHTLSYEFRKKQLLALKKALELYETDIYEALYADLKKSREEAYVTETGLVLADINYCLKNLSVWMSPTTVPTNLPNLMSTSTIYRDPLGVVLIIAPWNYPLQLLLIPLVGAIAGGNCAVLKPSEMAPATASLVEKLVKETFPGDYIRVIQGDGAAVVPAMLRSFRFDHIFYTGSIPTGKAIYQMAASELVPVTLELGGKSPAIVEKDADLAVAARRIVIGKFVNAGQTCIAPDYLLVHEAVKDKLLVLLKETISRFYTDDPAGSEEYAKIINVKRLQKLAGYLKQGRIVFGGGYDINTQFFGPTLMEDVSLQSDLMKEEIFGPILPIFTFSSSREAMEIVDRNPNPLALYLFTGNNTISKNWMTRVRFGGGCINNTAWHFTNHQLPFGGVGYSGAGYYHGKHSFDTFTRPKGVLETPSWFDPSIKYPPLKGKLKLFKWLIR